MKNYYVNEIRKMIESCDDLDLLDFVFKLLLAEC